MEKMRTWVLPTFLAAGTLFAWYNVSLQFSKFFVYYDTVFHFQNCIVPNPLLTPCFYGATAFAVAFMWSIVLALKPNQRSFTWLIRFLLFGVCFALVVLAYETLDFYKLIDLGGVSISCSPGVFPLKTPCFGGLLFFLFAYVAAWQYARLLRYSVGTITTSEDNTI